VRVLGFGTYDRSKHPRAGIILDGLSERGHDVVEVNEPLGFSTAERVAMLGRPWLAHRLVLRILRRWASLSRRARRACRPAPFDVVLVGYLGHFDVLLARLLFPRTRIVLDLLIFAADTARDRGVRTGPKLRLLSGLDALAVRCADLVVLDTEEQRLLLAPAARPKAVVVPVGAPVQWFRAGDAAASGTDAGVDPPGPLRVVFFGLYTPLQGATVIGTALAQLGDDPGITVTMVGTGQDREATQRAAAANPNVQWLDWVESVDLPALVAAHHVCLGIFGTTPKALRVVPNKVYQGAAAGCAILTSDTPPQRRILGDAAGYVPAGDAASLAAALRSLSTDAPRRTQLRAAARSIALERFGPVSVVGPLSERLELGRGAGK
jgi:glycosyltransferase involved in cell wall biosynthesis